MKAHAEDAESTVDELSHDEFRRLRPMADELARVAELTLDDPETFKGAADANAAFRGMVSRFEESGLAKMAKDTAERMDAINGPFAREFEKGAWATSSKIALDYEERWSQASERFSAHELTSKWLTDPTRDSMKMFGVAKFDLELKSESLMPAALEAHYRDEMAFTRLDKLMLAPVALKSKLDLFDDQLRRFDDLVGNLDPMARFENLGGVTRSTEVFDRHRADLAFPDPRQPGGALVVPSSGITMISRTRPISARCQICRGPVVVELSLDGTLEVFSPCGCSGLAQDIFRDVADNARRDRRPSLTLLQGDRRSAHGPGIPTGNLRIVRPVPDSTTDH